MRGWKSILSKYLIEFTVIVLGITTSYFVENYREEQWESKKEIRLLSELRKELGSYDFPVIEPFGFDFND